MKHQLVLNYTLGSGALAPYLDGLAKGIAMGAQCAQCDRTTFPPERLCPCEAIRNGSLNHSWLTLSGHARIIYRTDGTGGSFALAQFDGADNQTVCRIANPQRDGTWAKIKSTGDDKPGVVIEIIGEELETDG